MGLHKYRYSLRFRYTASAVVLVFFVLLSGYFAYLSTNQAQFETGQNLAKHHAVSEVTRDIRIGVLDAYTYIDAFLLEPSKVNYQEQALQSIYAAIQSVELLSAYAQDYPQLEQNKLSKLVVRLNDLKYRARILFEIRNDSSRQYPSLEAANTIMQPNRNAFNNAISLALYEMQSEGLNKSSPALYMDFLQARFLWSQVLSNFRLYLANRMGSFDEVALPIQEKSIHTMYKALQQQLMLLKTHSENDKLGFQASEGLVDMKRTARNWFSGFEIVVGIHHSDSWRMDSKLMKEEVVPVINEISSILFALERVLNASMTMDVEALARVTKQQVNIFMWAAIVLVIFLSLIYGSTVRLVLRPIDTVVRALRSQAAGKYSEMLPVVRSYETAALFDAFSEMSNRVQIRQEALEFQALHDGLTSLPNRTLLQERMAHQITISARENSHVTLLMIDLDRFKDVNDTLGHHVGDQLLINIGERLQTQLRANDTVARLGGDEFAVILPGTDCVQAKELCQKLSQTIAEVYSINELQLYISMSIGIACYPEHGNDVSTLIRHADVAMYVAKQNKLGCDIYDAKKDNNSLQRLGLHSDLREALDNDQLELYFQPVIDLETSRVSGVECLLRWEHPLHGWLSPEYIVELSEHTGLINPLTYWVIKKALKSGEELHDQGYPFRMAINISAHNLKELEFVTNVRKLLQASSLNVDYLSFEITENAMMSNPMLATRMLTEFNTMGIHLAIDDYGTGFSSLAYLKQLPVSELKIDRSFVQHMHTNANDETIVRSTIDLAHNLGMQVIAEGVETLDAYKMLASYGANKVQGYYMSKPVAMQDLNKWLRIWQAPVL